MAAEPIIRVAQAVDAAPLSSLAALTFPLACPPQTSADDVAAFIAEVLSKARFDAYLADPDRTILIAENGDLLGYAMLVGGEPSDAGVAAVAKLRPTVEISKMYVHPEAHGSGVATDLMTAALEFARTAELKAAWLGVNQLNVRAQTFYRKLGFQIVGTKTFRVGKQRHDDYVMERAL